MPDVTVYDAFNLSSTIQAERSIRATGGFVHAVIFVRYEELCNTIWSSDSGALTVTYIWHRQNTKIYIVGLKELNVSFALLFGIILNLIYLIMHLFIVELLQYLTLDWKRQQYGWFPPHNETKYFLDFVSHHWEINIQNTDYFLAIFFLAILFPSGFWAHVLQLCFYFLFFWHEKKKSELQHFVSELRIYISQFWENKSESSFCYFMVETGMQSIQWWYNLL